MFGDIVMFRGGSAARGTSVGLLVAAGTGGIALTVWTLRGWGLSAANVAGRLVCYMILTYAVYLLALASAGFGLSFGMSRHRRCGRQHDRRVPRLRGQGFARHARGPGLPHDLVLAADRPRGDRLFPPATPPRHPQPSRNTSQLPGRAGTSGSAPTGTERLRESVSPSRSQRAAISPNTNPPTWAKNATPPPLAWAEVRP